MEITLFLQSLFTLINEKPLVRTYLMLYFNHFSS